MTEVILQDVLFKKDRANADYVFSNSIRSAIACHCFRLWNKLVHFVKLEWPVWETVAHIQNWECNSLQWWDYKGDNRPPYPSRTYKSMGPKCNFHANLEHTYRKISIFSVVVTQTLCFPCLTFWFIYTFLLFPFLIHSISLSAPHAGLMQALCSEYMCGHGVVLPSCSCRFIYSCDILSFCLIQLSASQGYRCFR